MTVGITFVNSAEELKLLLILEGVRWATLLNTMGGKIPPPSFLLILRLSHREHSGEPSKRGPSSE